MVRADIDRDRQIESDADPEGLQLEGGAKAEHHRQLLARLSRYRDCSLGLCGQIAENSGFPRTRW